MSEELYNIILTGGIREGFTREEVIGRLARMTKRSPATIEKLFQQPDPAIARNVVRGDVRLYLAKVGKTGAVAKAEMMHGEGGAPFPLLSEIEAIAPPPPPAPRPARAAPAHGGHVLAMAPPATPMHAEPAAAPGVPPARPASARAGTARKQKEKDNEKSRAAGTPRPAVRKAGASKTAARKAGKPRPAADPANAGGLRALLNRFTSGPPRQNARSLELYLLLGLVVVTVLVVVFMLL